MVEGLARDSHSQYEQEAREEDGHAARAERSDSKTASHPAAAPKPARFDERARRLSTVTSRPVGPNESPAEASREPESLWREVVGEQVRRVRAGRGERLTDVAERASVSPQYLSEIERGVKDPSSEMLAAVAGALETSVEGLVRRAYGHASVVPLSAAPSHARSRRSPSGPASLAA